MDLSKDVGSTILQDALLTIATVLEPQAQLMLGAGLELINFFSDSIFTVHDEKT